MLLLPFLRCTHDPDTANFSLFKTQQPETSINSAMLTGYNKYRKFSHDYVCSSVHFHSLYYVMPRWGGGANWVITEVNS
jgi:hypothetical protein